MQMICAMAANGAIGNNNALLFHIKEDMKYFREFTAGKCIVMGRKTFESLPNVLEGRKHIVLTTDNGYKFDHPDVIICNEVSNVIELVSNSPAVVIGGASIYKTFANHCDELHLTQINRTPITADVFFPTEILQNFKVQTVEKLTDDAKVYVYTRYR